MKIVTTILTMTALVLSVTSIAFAKDYTPEIIVLDKKTFPKKKMIMIEFKDLEYYGELELTVKLQEAIVEAKLTEKAEGIEDVKTSKGKLVTMKAREKGEIIFISFFDVMTDTILQVTPPEIE
jgi:hypothetical protein